MDFEIHYTDQQQRFREALRAWLDDNVPKDLDIPPDGRPLDKETQQKVKDFRCKLGEKGWLAPSWPLEWGGGGLHPELEEVFLEEIRRLNLPSIGNTQRWIPPLLVWGSPEQKERGVVLASSGNFGQGMAYAGQIFGAKVIVVLPENPNPSKMAAIKAFGAEVALSDTIYDSDPAAIREIMEKRGCQYVSDSTDARFMAGSGTIMLEILDQLPDVDAVIFPVGGGGLASGVSIAAKGLKPDTEVIGVCSAQAASPYLSWKKGDLEESPMNTFAEGIGVKVTEDIPFRIMSELLDDFVAVDDDEIRQAIVLLLEKTHNLSEGAGAAPLAAALRLKDRLQGKKVALIQSGGNASIEELKASLGAA